MARERIAVIGSGVSGLTTAYLLRTEHEVTLYEADTRLGGHAHTHTVPGADGTPVAVDSGFIVHNDRTYPHLLRLFGELGVATRDTEMSMSISDARTGIEYAGGRGVSGFLARPRQLARRDYLDVLTSVKRFHRVAGRFLAETDDTDERTLGEFVSAAGFSTAFTDLYAVPLVSCVWSTGGADALHYPARYLFRFLDHHGMLSVTGSPQWRTVVGGSQTYVEAIADRLADIRRGAAVVSVRRAADAVGVTAAGQVEDVYDRVVIATAADRALALLADPTPAERAVLGAFRSSTNETVLHQDPSFLPRAERARASWNYRVERGDAQTRNPPPVVTYDMNRLQGIDARTPLYVTLNATARIDPRTILASMAYRHPVYDLPAIRAQRRRAEITTARTAYAGAYWGWGFHEDGARSGVEAAAAFGVSW
ncbi:MAG: FAD-dependent oxidoreductase [Tetrasphaera sp.]|nr:FAD-dependent oxidoreductase [Tetrasphaera sp.]